jgi:membrane fusion protein (multidrug efflux system)
VIVEGGQKVRVGDAVVAQNAGTRSRTQKATPVAIAQEG